MTKITLFFDSGFPTACVLPTTNTLKEVPQGKTTNIEVRQLCGKLTVRFLDAQSNLRCPSISIMENSQRNVVAVNVDHNQ